MSPCLMMGCFLHLRVTLTGEPEFTTAEEAKKEVDDLIDIRKYHHDGEDLSEFPCVVNLNDAGSIDRLTIATDVCIVSRYLDHGGSAKGEWT